MKLIKSITPGQGIAGNRWRLWFIVLLSVALLTSCSNQNTLHQDRIVAFGTIIDISLWGADATAAHDISAALTEQFNTFHQRYHAWEKSVLSDLNTRLDAGERVVTDAQTSALLAQAQSLAEASDGLFNPTIGKLVALWGFHSDDAPQGPPPDPQRIAALRSQHPSMADVVIRDRTVWTTNPGVQLDLGGFAKGVAVDLAIDLIRAHGIDHAIVNAGGDLRAIGSKDGRPWRIGIRHPRASGVLASLETRNDESVFTSGDYERYFEFDGQRYHHIIDPRSGYPAPDTASVTVVHHDAATADAAATALFIAGPRRWPQVARKMGIQHVMLVDNEGRVYLTPSMAERVRFEVEPPPPLSIQPL